jgi:hypothetical protein
MTDFHIPGLDTVFNEIKQIPGGSLFVKIVCVVIGLAMLGWSTKVVARTLVEPSHDLIVSLISGWRGVPQIHTAHILDLIAWPIALGITSGLATAALYYLRALQRKVNDIRFVMAEHGGLFKDILALVKMTTADFFTLTKLGAENLHDSSKLLLAAIQPLNDAIVTLQDQINMLKSKLDAIEGNQKN